MNELNNKDEWAEIEAMFPVDTDEEQLNFANANKIIGLREARPQIEQYVIEQVRLELETLRKSMRGEDPDQYRPRDMVSMSFVEEVIDAHLAQLSATTLLEGEKK